MWVHLVKKILDPSMYSILHNAEDGGIFHAHKDSKSFQQSKGGGGEKQLGNVIPVKQSPSGWQRQASSYTQISWSIAPETQGLGSGWGKDPTATMNCYLRNRSTCRGGTRGPGGARVEERRGGEESVNMVHRDGGQSLDSKLCYYRLAT